MKITTQKRALDKIYKRRDRYDVPDWQREEVWSLAKQQKLIDSILRGWRLPKFYFSKVSDTHYEVVDGQQRLAAIYAFLDNELILSLESAAIFGGVSYSELSEEASDAFDDFEIDFDEIEGASDEEIKEFFLRLQEGLPLTSSEKLNAVNSKLRNFAQGMAKHKFFSETVPLKSKRYAHFDVASKVLAIEIEGLDVGFRYEDLKGVFESHKNFSNTSKAAQRITSALSFLHSALPEKSPLLRNRSFIQTLINSASRLLENGTKPTQAEKFGEFVSSFASRLAKQVELGHQATDQDMLTFQRTINANVRSGPKIRQAIFFRKLFAEFPEFAAGFDALALKISGVDIEIQAKSETIQSHVERINTAYSAKNGVDLFKSTNKTVSALTSMAKPAGSFEDYEKLVSELYFVFWEGPGEKFGNDKPTSFRKINTLRTMLQHDIDHGDSSKIRKKNLNAGNIFLEYAGVSSPSLAAPETFPIVQLKILSEVAFDLSVILDELMKNQRQLIITPAASP